MKDITCTEIQRKIAQKEEVLLIDVREPSERRGGNHIGGKNIPLGQLGAKMKQIEKHSGKEIIVYCRSGKRSEAAKKMLEKAGFKKVRNLKGGLEKCQLSQ